MDILIFTVREGRLSLLLARRKNPPFRNYWALPGRFVGLEESAEAAVRKLLAEMLPVRDVYMEQLYTFTALNRDPRGRTISMAYMIILPWQKLQAALEEEDVQLRCFGVNHDAGGLYLTAEGEEAITLTAGDLAFDHGEIIRTGVTRLQGKIDYTDVSFRFLSDTAAFSLSELQTVFEAVLDTPVDSSNFRRSIRGRYEQSGRIEQTVQAKQQGRGRPAVLYRLVK
ncbi:MAG: NUDIX hydrolase [Clostridia bacterium]|nr:NUDIX hydrolase [Clostridia bacterium]